MRRRSLLNLALVGVLLLVAAVLRFGPRPPEAEPPQTVSATDPAGIERIRIERAQAPPVVLSRGAGGWRMLEPAAAPAHAARVEALLGLLGERSLASFPAAGVDLARFGLAAPQVVLELGAHRAAFGDPHPMEERRYIQFDDRVQLVPDSMFVQLMQNAGFFIDNRLLPAGAQPRAVQYPGFVMRRSTGAWRAEPQGAHAPAELAAAAREWTRARALAVRTPAQAGGAHGRVRVETGAGSVIEFSIVTLEPAPVLARSDLNLQYHLDAVTAAALLLAAPAAE